MEAHLHLKDNMVDRIFSGISGAVGTILITSFAWSSIGDFALRAFAVIIIGFFSGSAGMFGKEAGKDAYKFCKAKLIQRFKKEA